MPAPRRFRNTEEILEYIADLNSESEGEEEEESDDESDIENDVPEGNFAWKPGIILPYSPIIAWVFSVMAFRFI